MLPEHTHMFFGFGILDSGFGVRVIKIISLICRLVLVPNKSAAWVLEI